MLLWSVGAYNGLLLNSPTTTAPSISILDCTDEFISSPVASRLVQYLLAIWVLLNTPIGSKAFVFLASVSKVSSIKKFHGVISNSVSLVSSPSNLLLFKYTSTWVATPQSGLVSKSSVSM